MSEYHYLSSSKSSQRAVKRMIGMQIFYRRHKYRIYAESLCEKAHITLRELENVELGMGKRSAPKWFIINRILNALNLQLDVKAFKKN